MKNIYYAHSMLTYNTKREKREIDFLKKHFKSAKIINPNIDVKHECGMSNYLKTVEKSDMVICSSYKGHIGRGVYEEINHALNNKIPVQHISSLSCIFFLRNIKGTEITNPYDWKVYYGKVKKGGD